ncbi:MAG TPA: hypothetical protein VFD90_15100 [Gaiellales bacterium]|nr:hypothetical protein [Gaiellales bacterium]
MRARRLLIVDVVPAVLERGALTDAAWPLMTQPSARALSGEDLRRSEAFAQVSDPELMLYHAAQLLSLDLRPGKPHDGSWDDGSRST